ncbi:MAG: tetratricopeptide repeat protein [Candidatus Latescibacterota bacterium]|nr:tetratricopeptide repeat protein [Candidatus Latescibacterota bacterium]
MAVGGVLLLAFLLRVWGLLSGNLVPHPDEIFMVIYPLGLFSGDLNPHHFHYPNFHFYELGLVYGLHFIVQYLFGEGRSLIDWAAHHFFWGAESMMDVARLIGVAYSMGTVALAGLLARELATWRGHSGSAERCDIGQTAVATFLAMLLMAVNVLHVRQSPIASVDVPLAFWFGMATWGGLRLLTRHEVRDYLIAGTLVGLSAACKYPGVMSCAAVMTAHLIARRRVLDSRLWLAGLASIVTFLALSPYIALDFETFRAHFLHQIVHVEEGRDFIPAPFYHHLWISLRLGSGHLVWVVSLAAFGVALWERRSAHLAVVAPIVCGYAMVSWGELVFLRYALPLLALQAALSADLVARFLSWVPVRTPQLKWAPYVCALLLTAEPLHESLHTVRLQSMADTRRQARADLTEIIPDGSVCCNFGGWAGDVPLWTYEELWWRSARFVSRFGMQQLADAIPDLTANRPDEPFVSYALQGRNRHLSEGSMELLHGRECRYVLMHRHSLVYSAVDSGFVPQLERIAERFAVWGPPIAEDSAHYDPMDGYYLPFDGGRSVARTGPTIEAWRVRGYERRSNRPDNPFSQAFAVWAAVLMREGRPKDARVALEAARVLEPKSPYVAMFLSAWEGENGDLAQALEMAQYVAEGAPWLTGAKTHYGRLLRQAGRLAEAERQLLQARGHNPMQGEVWHELAMCYFESGAYAEAAEAWTRAIELRPTRADYSFNLAYTYLEYLDAPERAVAPLRTAMAKGHDVTDAQIKLAQAYLKTGNRAEAMRWYEEALLGNPDEEQKSDLATVLLQLNRESSL